MWQIDLKNTQIVDSRSFAIKQSVHGIGLQHHLPVMITLRAAIHSVHFVWACCSQQGLADLSAICALTAGHIDLSATILLKAKLLCANTMSSFALLHHLRGSCEAHVTWRTRRSCHVSAPPQRAVLHRRGMQPWCMAVL